jgi:hypothetical protein
MGWYLLRIRGELSDVTLDGVVIREIVGIGFLAVQIPFGSEDASPPDAFKTFSEPANTGEKVNEREPSRTVRDTLGRGFLEQL